MSRGPYFYEDEGGVQSRKFRAICENDFLLQSFFWL